MNGGEIAVRFEGPHDNTCSDFFLMLKFMEQNYA